MSLLMMNDDKELENNLRSELSFPV